MRPPESFSKKSSLRKHKLSSDFYRYQRFKSGNLKTTAAGSPNILWSHGKAQNLNHLFELNIKPLQQANPAGR
jgi:hypothetical protein